MNQSRFLLVACVCLLPFISHAENGAGGIAAIVNDTVVTNSDVNARVNLIVQGARAQPDAATRKQLSQQTLQSLIEEQIRMSEVKKQDIAVDDAEIDDGIDKLAAQNNIPPDKFRMLLQQVPGNLETLRNQIRVQAGWGKLVRQKLRPQVTVTDTDIDTYLSEQKKQTGKTEYELAEILLPYHDTVSENAMRALTQKIIVEMQTKHTRFSVLAKQFSQGAEANKGGLLGFVKEGQFDAALEQAAKAMNIGDVSPPVKTASAYHVLYLKNKRQIMSLEESSKKLQIKQLFIPAPPQAPDDYVQQAYGQMKQWQSQATDCIAMQKIITANPSPMSRDLGMMSLSDMPQPVAALVKDAPTGKALDPLRAADGFLLLMVCGHDDAAGGEAVRDAAANIIGSERLNRLQRRYFRDLKDAAYIDIKAK